MLGTFGGALEARQIDASNGKLVAEVTGEVETEENVLVIRRIRVAMRLRAPESVREVVERVHGFYAMRCPLYRTLHERNRAQLHRHARIAARRIDSRSRLGLCQEERKGRSKRGRSLSPSHYPAAPLRFRFNSTHEKTCVTPKGLLR